MAMDGHLLAAAHEHTTHLTSVQTACTLTKQNQEKHTDKSHEQLPAKRRIAPGRRGTAIAWPAKDQLGPDGWKFWSCSS